MKNYLLIVVGVVALAFLTLIFIGGEAPSANDVDMAFDTEAFVEDAKDSVAFSAVAELVAQNNSGISGIATLAQADGKTRVVLKLVGAPLGISQPAHIHAGSCSNLGAVRYPLSYPVDGASETLLEVSLETLTSTFPLAINVHKNIEEAGVYVACGAIAL